MSYVDTYIKNSKHGDFQWECVETTDGIGMGGVLIEEVNLKGRFASITRESDNEFEIEVTLNYPINYYNDREKDYEITDYRASRKSARVFAERLIKKDIEKDEIK